MIPLFSSRTKRGLIYSVIPLPTPSPSLSPGALYLSYLPSCTPTEVLVHSPGSKVSELVTDVRCGLDGTLLLTNTGRLFACGK